LSFLHIAQREKSGRVALAFVQWQEQYMANYPIVRPMYVTQRDAILQTADLVIDGNLPPADLAAAILKALAGHVVTL
jgi:hypothetical protein